MSPQALVDAVRSWVGTPYHHHSRVKGAGVDCIQLLIAAHSEAGLVSDDIDTGTYSTDWHLHRNEELYLCGIQEYLSPVDNDELSVLTRLAINATWSAPSGAVIVFRVGRTFSHGGIVTEFPQVVHACQPSRMVEEIDITKYLNLASRPAKIFIHKDLDR